MNKYAEQSRQAQWELKRRRRCLRKKVFDTEEEAAACPGQTPYLCEFCGKWHRTSQVVKLVRKCRRIGRGVGGYKVKKEVRSLRSAV
jgi:hypothetical protein